ncbi:DUF2533 family protein [Bacillus sp. Marseille-P3661]|uniref:DUF2533 family protein n=1 Tax=Bacillus sp. Marseille-P3661 TaxID=1936234 RepID=UPI000C8529C7|nr:DUF2533 family protein [Bacillus sp. Marseille-P3661]
MSVHKAISSHSEKQHYIVKTFTELDAKRERYIEKAVQQCMNNQPFSIKEINEITKEMNELSKKGIVTSLPVRQQVSDEMVQEYVQKLKK